MHVSHMFGSKMDWSSVDFRGADLRRRNFHKCNLTFANLYGADLRGADLSFADLRQANLDRAQLDKANITGAKFSWVQLPQGSLVVWKCLRGGLAKLEIPYAAKRTGCLASQMCRAEYARVLWLENGESDRDNRTGRTIYTVGDMVHASGYSDDIRVPHGPGIHFVLHKWQALQYMSQTTGEVRNWKWES